MKILYTENTVLAKDKKFTYLASDVAAGASTATVQNMAGFHMSWSSSTGQILLIGKIGEEKTEIIKTSAVTLPTGGVVTTATAFQFDHPQDTRVTIVDWDRLQHWWAATVTGTKETLAAYPIALQVDHPETQYKDTAKSSGYYFFRFNDSITPAYSDYSDPLPYADYADNSVFKIKERALFQAGEVIDENVITHKFLNDSLWQARREFHNAPGKRPFRRKFNVSLGDATTGMWRINAPSDLEDAYTAENIYGVRFGTNDNLKYVDKKDLDSEYAGIARTNLDVAYTIGDQDLWCDDVSNFSDSGSVTVEDDVIEYSAKGLSGGTLRISAAGDHNHDVSKDVWQNASFGIPRGFTFFVDGQGTAAIYFDRPLATAYVGLDIFVDYYRTLVEYDSDADELDEPVYDMFVPYLAFKIKQRKSRGGLNPATDGDYLEWTMLKKAALDGEFIDSEIRMRPDIDHLL
jgi:hypothetical protein